MRMLTIDDLDLEGKTVFIRVDMNVPIHPDTLKIIESIRIDEASTTIRELEHSKVIVGSHQGRVGRYDYIDLSQHAEVLEERIGRDVRFVEDVMGPESRRSIEGMREGDVLLLDNLRFCAEENYEFTPKDAASTVMVRRLARLMDACILDCFPSAHRAHPSIVGFPYLLPACAGRLVAKEVHSLDRVLTVAKGPYVVVLGGSKISDRLEAIETLIQGGRADKVLLTGLISIIFLMAQGRFKANRLGVKEEALVEKAKRLMQKYPNVFMLPVDYATENNGERVEKSLDEFSDDDTILDIGSRTIDNYEKVISGAGTVFMSGPAGAFEREQFAYGTRTLLEIVARSLSTTIVSGGHMTAALQRFGLADRVDHISTAGGALVLYLAGKKLPMMEVLEMAYERVAAKA
ncbi:MAG: phosphoglycerate kinase [Candidatus Nitrosocaldus sp.]|nr:phosphoglycerate kinase [Candidatus Nitrosocaldus sp.]